MRMKASSNQRILLDTGSLNAVSKQISNNNNNNSGSSKNSNDNNKEQKYVEKEREWKKCDTEKWEFKRTEMTFHFLYFFVGLTPPLPKFIWSAVSGFLTTKTVHNKCSHSCKHIFFWRFYFIFAPSIFLLAQVIFLLCSRLHFTLSMHTLAQFTQSTCKMWIRFSCCYDGDDDDDQDNKMRWLLVCCCFLYAIFSSWKINS